MQLWVFLFFLTGHRVLAASLLLDDFSYVNATAARAAWLSNGNAPAVSMADSGVCGSRRVLVLPCDFATRPSRCFWDRNVSLDLASFAQFELEVFSADPGAFAGFTLYFRSGPGWYGCSAAVTTAGWQTLRFSTAEFIAEGTPSGWSQISGIRLSPWKGATRQTELALDQLRAFTPTILVVRDTQSSNPVMVTETVDRHLDFLGRYGISCGVITEAGVEAGLLAGCRVAIFPYNENFSIASWTRLESFVAGGGKLMVYYLLPARMEPLLGVRRTGWVQGDFAGWTFADPTVQGLPERVAQASWNITTAEPDGSLNARVVAGWENSRGEATGRGAWFGSDHGWFMSHVLLGDDANEKAYTLLCLLGHTLPELWPPAATNAVNRIGGVAGFRSFAEAEAAIRQQGRTTLRSSFVETELAGATADRESALQRMAVGMFAPSILAARSAHEHVVRAFLQSRKPVAPEFRAFWEHHATGPYPGDWPAAIDILVTNGFNAVFPNMLWGGLAHYASDVLPRSAEFATYGDQITACVNAAHARGLQVHVWKVNWNLSGASRSFVEDLRMANRTQVTRDGQPMDWLCPSHPENLALETNSLLEVVRRYDVDGIHFDYIRYPGSESCYCSGCFSRFQAQSGRVVNQWPADVLAAGALRTAFLDWRRAQITRLVSAVHAGSKALKPDVKISAAVFPDAPSAYDDVGQDWRGWIDARIVDFLCPMDYTTDIHRFTNLMSRQLGFAGGRVPVYPGIGAHALEADGVVAQIEAARGARTGGFVLFELSATSSSALLPALRAGITASDEPDSDGDLLADRWEIRWFGSLGAAGTSTDTDGDGVGDLAEYTAGGIPTEADSGLTVEIRLYEDVAEISCRGWPTETPGYENAERRYRLERTKDLSHAGSWAPVQGFPDRMARTRPETLVFPVAPVSGEAWAYRVRTWLQEPR